jgi:hypothetical protein
VFEDSDADDWPLVDVGEERCVEAEELLIRGLIFCKLALVDEDATRSDNKEVWLRPTRSVSVIKSDPLSSPKFSSSRLHMP